MASHLVITASTAASRSEAPAARGNVQAVARRLGFPDPFAFSRQFRKRTGITPSQFRLRQMPEMR